jgi:uncharacterized RDD family membrane protein YckC
MNPVQPSQMPPGGWDRPVSGSPPPMAPFASWGSRVGAALMDAIVVLVPALLLGAAIFGGFTEAWSDDDSGIDVLGAVVAALVYLLLLAVIAIIYAPLLMRRPGEHNGQTWGKQLFGIRVVRTNGVPMDFTWSAVREPLVKGLGLGIASTFIPLVPYLLDVLWPLWDDENRAIHDMVVGTRVVKA